MNKATCKKCHMGIKRGEEHIHHGMILCEDCFIDEVMAPKRKTHWQYLRSIKTEYLRYGTGK